MLLSVSSVKLFGSPPDLPSFPTRRSSDLERHPAATEPVGGIFRAVHTVKGMAATMGYGRVADLAHRMENLLDHLRRGGKPPTRSEEHTSELQSLRHLVCRLLLEKKKKNTR